MKFGVFYNPMVLRSNGEWNPGYPAKRFNEMLEQIEFADHLGYEYAFLGEHHFTAEYAHNSAPEVVLGALARSTKNIRLGHGIVHTSHNDPVRTAERIATLDVISGGRAEYGFGSGGAFEVAPFLDDPNDRSARSQAFSQISVDVLASPQVYPGVDNEFYKLPPVNVVPKVVQTPHPPLWTSTTSVAQATGTAEKGLGNLMLSSAGPDEVKAAVDAYWDTLKSDRVTPIGRGINPAVFTFGSGLIAPTDELARERAKDGMDIFAYGLTGGIGHLIQDPEASLVDVFNDYQAGRGDVREALGIPEGFRRFGDAWSDLPGNFMCSPETARQKLRALEATHVDGFLLNQHFGETSHEHIMESLELFATEVMPEFQERHAEHEVWRKEQLSGIDHPIVSSL